MIADNGLMKQFRVHVEVFVSVQGDLTEANLRHLPDFFFERHLLEQRFNFSIGIISSFLCLAGQQRRNNKKITNPEKYGRFHGLQ